jgi:hypothetical protein
MLSEPAQAALRTMTGDLARMSPAEQAEYLAKIGAPFAVLSKLRAILKEIEGIDRALLEGLLLSFLKALGAVADGVAASLSLAENFDRMAMRLAVRDEVGPSEGGRDRLKL